MGNETPNTNPLLAGIKNVPGLSIVLPTKALLYKHGELKESALKSGELHVFPMSAKDELVLKSPDLLINGEAITRVVTRCAPEVLKPLDLFQPDMDAILIALRISTYGEGLRIQVDNKYYDAKKKGSQEILEYTVNLKKLLTGGKALTSLSECVVKLETGQKATIQPIRFDLGLQISQEDMDSLSEADDEAKMEMFKKRMQTVEDVLLSMICEIDGISNREQIKEWFELVPAVIFKTISEKAEEMAVLGPLTEIEIKDPISDQKWKTTVPINPADFFAFGPNTETSKK